MIPNGLSQTNCLSNNGWIINVFEPNKELQMGLKIEAGYMKTMSLRRTLQSWITSSYDSSPAWRCENCDTDVKSETRAIVILLWKVHVVLHRQHVALMPFSKNARVQTCMHMNRNTHTRTHTPPVVQVKSVIFTWCESVMREGSSDMWASCWHISQEEGGLDSTVTMEPGAVTFTPHTKWVCTHLQTQ